MSFPRVKNTEFLQPFDYVMASPGKNLRKQISKILNYWYGVPNEVFNNLVAVLDRLHNASLM